jgi:hydroxyethylthiazole kinase-like uncharacterized protein yjeF
MTPLYTVAQVRQIEEAAAASLPPGTLMARAGRAAADLVLALPDPKPKRILLLAGPGNNGGDACEMAACLATAGYTAELLLALPEGDLPADAARALAKARQAPVQFLAELPDTPRWDLIVDGLFGIGLSRPITGPMAGLVERINGWDCPVLALDVPSGIDADTGAVVGPGGLALRAGLTVTFIASKPGLHTADALDHVGRLRIASLGLDADALGQAECGLLTPALFASHLAPRARNSHKGSYGDVGIIGGAQGMSGAAILAARGALLGGAGRVFVAALAGGIAHDWLHPELMFRGPEPVLATCPQLVLGPGMGTDDLARACLERALDGPARLVLDADALNLIATRVELQERLRYRSAGTVLTPHPLEAARLLGVTAPVVQADRISAARELAARLNSVVLLKGAGSVVARPDGLALINTSGNPALATAGSGDVLSGLMGSLMAQGWPLWEASLAGVWLHGHAADLWAAEHGSAGLAVSELPALIRRARHNVMPKPPARWWPE